jgi:hypothetical protein
VTASGFAWRLEYRLPGEPWDGHGVPYHSEEMARSSYEAMAERVNPDHDVRLIRVADGRVVEEYHADDTG